MRIWVHFCLLLLISILIKALKASNLVEFLAKQKIRGMAQKSMDRNGLLMNQRNCTVKKAFEGSHVTSVSGR